MNPGIRILLVLVGLGSLAIPFFAAPRGFGLKSQTNSAVVMANRDCPPEKRDNNGNCPVNRNLRSRSFRNFMGGGTGTGK